MRAIPHLEPILREAHRPLKESRVEAIEVGTLAASIALAVRHSVEADQTEEVLELGKRFILDVPAQSHVEQVGDLSPVVQAAINEAPHVVLMQPVGNIERPFP